MSWHAVDCFADVAFALRDLLRHGDSELLRWRRRHAVPCARLAERGCHHAGARALGSEVHREERQVVWGDQERRDAVGAETRAVVWARRRGERGTADVGHSGAWRNAQAAEQLQRGGRGSVRARPRV